MDIYVLYTLSGPAAPPVIWWGQPALGDRLGCSWVARVSWANYLKDAVKDRRIFTGAPGREVIPLMAASSTCTTCLVTPWLHHTELWRRKLLTIDWTDKGRGEWRPANAWFWLFSLHRHFEEYMLHWRPLVPLWCAEVWFEVWLLDSQWLVDWPADAWGWYFQLYLKWRMGFSG